MRFLVGPLAISCIKASEEGQHLRVWLHSVQVLPSLSRQKRQGPAVGHVSNSSKSDKDLQMSQFATRPLVEIENEVGDSLSLQKQASIVA